MLFHLAVINDDTKMEEAIARILPRILPSVAKSAAVRTKAVEVISFVSGALKARPAMRVPLAALLDLHTGAASSPAADAVADDSMSSSSSAAAVAVPAAAPNAFLDSFTIMFLEMGFSRLSAAASPSGRSASSSASLSSSAHWDLAPRLLENLSLRTPALQATLLHVFALCLPHMTLEGMRADRSRHFAALLDEKNRTIVLQFFTDVLLYSPHAAASAAVAAAAAATAATAAAASSAPAGSNAAASSAASAPNAAALLALPPPGMSVEAVSRVTRDGKANLAGAIPTPGH